jgi:acetyltransferase-like isoleucine patch superfamily enzyme
MNSIKLIDSNLIKLFYKWKFGRHIYFEDGVTFYGHPHIVCVPGAHISIGQNSVIVSDFRVNIAGINHPTILASVSERSKITIGKESGISGATLVAVNQIDIGDRVGLGVNVQIYDTDFHLEDPRERYNQKSIKEAESEPVKIGNDVWIGANVMILKGVSIGDQSIVGAGSIVTRDIPPNCVYAGNPARYIRRIQQSECEIKQKSTESY